MNSMHSGGIVGEYGRVMKLRNRGVEENMSGRVNWLLKLRNTGLIYQKLIDILNFREKR